ncbi:CHAP domain-containing protein [Arthrobacter sulfonylureivorans]|uniref:CHAP domain-containing protein n=1 Tax=Arthrobacter sulfonylureivorans TaxID=2486855 RepID=UPI0039E307B0
MARRAPVMDKNKLASIKVTGKGLSRNLVDACTGATLAVSNSSITSMGLTFLDGADLNIFRSGLLSKGASISYGQWGLTVQDVKVKSSALGPSLEVSAPSKFVTKLKAQTGERSWGETNLSTWATDAFKSVGALAVVQPSLGSLLIARQKPEDGKAESTWDVLTALAREKGLWLFEYGTAFVLAKPSWLARTNWARQSWSVWWNSWSSYHEALAGMPEYSDEADSDPSESLTLKLVATDWDIRTGDEVKLGGTGVGDMGGKWIVTGVKFPMTAAGVLTVGCQRPVDPAEQPREDGSGSGSSSSGGPGGTGSGKPGDWTGTVAEAATLSAATDRFVNRYNGVALDFDGAAGAQCFDLAQYFNKEVVGGPFLAGDGAKDLWNAPGLGGFYAMVGSGPARKGDLVIWDGSWGGGWGHVALALSDEGGSIRCLTQNPGASHIATLGKNGLLGYLRPIKWFGSTKGATDGRVV